MSNIIKNILNRYKFLFIYLLFLFYSTLANSADETSIAGVDDMIKGGKDMLRVAAKWGGIATVVVAALALGSGRLEGAFAQTISKILIVVGLLIAANGWFAEKLGWGFAF